MPTKQFVLIVLLAGVFVNPVDTCSLLVRPYDYPDKRASEVDQIKVELNVVKTLPDQLEMEVMVENTGGQDVFVMTDPVRVDGSKGPYVSIADESSGTIEVGVKLFPPPRYFLLSNAAGVKLQKLAAGTTLREVLQVSLPLSETMPPYGDKPRRKQIDPNRLQFVRASVGVLPDDEGINDLLQRKPFGPFVDGVEELVRGSFRSKRIIDLQRVYTSRSVRKA